MRTLALDLCDLHSESAGGSFRTSELRGRIFVARALTRKGVVVAAHFTHAAAVLALAVAREPRLDRRTARRVVMRLALAVRITPRGRTPVQAARSATAGLDTRKYSALERQRDQQRCRRGERREHTWHHFDFWPKWTPSRSVPIKYQFWMEKPVSYGF
jgi:hypothetical protein